MQLATTRTCSVIAPSGTGHCSRPGGSPRPIESLGTVLSDRSVLICRNDCPNLDLSCGGDPIMEQAVTLITASRGMLGFGIRNGLAADVALAVPCQRVHDWPCGAFNNGSISSIGRAASLGLAHVCDRGRWVALYATVTPSAADPFRPRSRAIELDRAERAPVGLYDTQQLKSTADSP
jgi:hypothetical protein